jgi:hypothetical protein
MSGIACASTREPQRRRSIAWRNWRTMNERRWLYEQPNTQL